MAVLGPDIDVPMFFYGTVACVPLPETSSNGIETWRQISYPSGSHHTKHKECNGEQCLQGRWHMSIIPGLRVQGDLANLPIHMHA